MTLKLYPNTVLMEHQHATFFLLQYSIYKTLIRLNILGKKITSISWSSNNKIIGEKSIPENVGKIFLTTWYKGSQSSSIKENIGWLTKTLNQLFIAEMIIKYQKILIKSFIRYPKEITVRLFIGIFSLLESRWIYSFKNVKMNRTNNK